MKLLPEKIESSIHSTLRKLYFSKDQSVLKVSLRTLLSPLVPLYALGRYTHQTYRRRKATSVSKPVVSVGNLALGGTGKTPFVAWLIETLTDRDINPAVLKRGEGQTEGMVPKNYDRLRSIAKDYGDEAALLRSRFPDISIAVGVNRVESARTFEEREDVDVLLLDDGLQYRLLKRDLDLVLLRESDLINNWQLPAGPLREPLATLEEVDFVSVYGGGSPESEEILEGKISSSVRRLTHRYEFEGIVRDGKVVTEQYVDESSVLVTSLARPESLEQFLGENGIPIHRRREAPDHSDPTKLVRETLRGSESVLLTEKEAVKLDSSLKQRVGIVKSRLTVQPADELIRAIDELTDQ